MKNRKWGSSGDSALDGMEGEENRRRQHEHSSFSRGSLPTSRGHSNITTSVQSVNRAQDLEGGDGYRQARYITSQPPTSSAISTNTNTQDITSFGPFSTAQPYPSTQLQGHGVPLHYQQDYTQDPQRQQPFSQQLMYTQQPPQQNIYDPVVQYPPRQSLSSEILPNQFGDEQFFHPGPSGSISASTNVPAQLPTAPYQQPLQYTPQADVDRPAIASQYPDPQPDFAQPATPSVIDPTQRQVDRYDAFYNQYRRALRETNQNASRGRLVEAGESLLEISQWLLGNAEGLGTFARMSIHDLELILNRTHQRQSRSSSRPVETLERF